MVVIFFSSLKFEVFSGALEKKIWCPFHQTETPRALIKLQKNVSTPETFHRCGVFVSVFAGQPFLFQFCRLLAVRFVWEEIEL